MLNFDSNTTPQEPGHNVSIANSNLRRRSLLKVLGGAGLAGTIASVTGPMIGCGDAGTVALPATTPSVIDVLNFALNLEYLEANFYAYVTTGVGLSAADMGAAPGSVTGGAKVAFTNPIVLSLASQLATHERQHVEFLRSTIAAVGGTPIDMPSINLAAGSAVTNDATFLAAARQLEAVGVSAYIGGAQFLVSSAQALTYAAQILDTESQHDGFIRELCIVLGVSSPSVDAMDNPPTMSKIFDTNPMNGLNPVRTASQVLQIVYGTPGQTGVTKGGFFPNGLNGNIVIS